MTSLAQEEILDTCVAKLRALKPIRDVIVQRGQAATDIASKRPYMADGAVSLRTDFGRLDYKFEIKKALSPQQLDHLLVEMRSFHKKKEEVLLLTDYVAPPMARRLVAAGINFIDTAGNAYLDHGGKLYVLIRGQKRPLPTDRKALRLFQPRGLQVLYVLLSDPNYAGLQYRHLATLSGASLGTVSQVMKEMRHRGYLQQVGRDNWVLVRYPELLEQWVTGYGARLRPKLLVDRIEPPGRDLELALRSVEKLAIRNMLTWAMTGGWGADVLVHHYHGDQLALFVENWSHNLLRELKWLPSPNGSITLLRLFSPAVVFDTQRNAYPPVAHPLLVYSELVFQGRERDLETAHIVHNQYLRPLYDVK